MVGNSQLVSWWPVLCVRAQYYSSEACDVSICVTIPPETAMLFHGHCCPGFPMALRRALKDAGGTWGRRGAGQGAAGAVCTSGERCLHQGEPSWCCVNASPLKHPLNARWR